MVTCMDVMSNNNILNILFNSRNNGYAISTPIIDQYRGDGIGLCFFSLDAYMANVCCLLKIRYS